MSRAATPLETTILVAKDAAFYAVGILVGLDLLVMIPFLILVWDATAASFFLSGLVALLGVLAWLWLLNKGEAMFRQARDAEALRGAPPPGPVTAEAAP